MARWAGPSVASGVAISADLIAPASIPPLATARAAGYALTALDTLDASPANPSPLASAPPRVKIGTPMPPVTDCVLPPDAVERCAGLSLVMASAMPGEGVRRAGADARAGQVLLPAGRRLRADHPPLWAMMGIGDVAGPPLQALIGALGGVPEGLQVIISDDPASEPLEPVLFEALALRPGADARFGFRDGQPTLIVPALADAAVALWLALLGPAFGLQREPMETAPLAAKIVSAIGFDELALLVLSDGAFHPLAVGDLPLSALCTATHWALLPATSEGVAAGASFSATRLGEPS